MQKIVLLLSFLLVFSYASSLKDIIKKTLESSPDVILEKKNQEAYQYYVDEKKSKYLPSLDVGAYLEKSNTKKDPKVGKEETIDKNGQRAYATINQFIYDGGLTPSEVRQMKHENLANKYRSLNNIENTVLQTSRAYKVLVESKELISLTNRMIKINEKNLSIAKEKEEINGDVLESYQVTSKLNFLKDRLYEEKNSEQEQLNALKKYAQLDIKDKVCKPLINTNLIPNKLEDVIKKAILNNYQIKEQMQKIEIQKEKIAQNNASFLPSINFELGTSIDNDLQLDDGGSENKAYGRLNFSWNLYKGGANSIKSQQEKTFLEEQKKSLDAITDKIVEDVKNQYYRYLNDKKRIEVLKNNIDANTNIVEVYKDEFEAGTRTFVDILNAEVDLYQSIKNLIEREYSLYDNYYGLLYNFSILSSSLLNETNQDCSKVQVKRYKISSHNKDKKDSLGDLKDLLDDSSSNKTLDSTNLKAQKKPNNEKIHQVKAGDTLYSISKKYKVSLEKLKSDNKTTSNLIKTGDKLIISK